MPTRTSRTNPYETCGFDRLVDLDMERKFIGKPRCAASAIRRVSRIQVGRDRRRRTDCESVRTTNFLAHQQRWHGTSASPRRPVYSPARNVHSRLAMVAVGHAEYRETEVDIMTPVRL